MLDCFCLQAAVICELSINALEIFRGWPGLNTVLILPRLKFGPCVILGFRIWSDLEIMTDEAEMEPDLQDERDNLREGGTDYPLRKFEEIGI